MSLIDIAIVVFALAMAAIGWERGLVRSALPLAGFIAGVFAGARLAPSLLDGGAESPYAPAVAAGGGILLGLFLAVALEGVGRRLSETPRRAQGRAHGRLAGGAILFLGLALLATWVFGAVALNLPGQNAREVRESVQRSSILVALNDVAPPSGGFLNALRRDRPLALGQGPEADVGPPDPAIVRDPEVQAASRSVVRVTGSACGLGIEGSGWIAGPGRRGHQRARRRRAGRHRGHNPRTARRWTPRRFTTSRENDLAVLSVPGLAGTAARACLRSPARAPCRPPSDIPRTGR